MDYKKLKIAVLYGGESSEREVSLNSGKAVFEGLQSLGYNVHLIDTKFTPIDSLKELGFEHCFNVLHGGMGENGQVQAVLDTLGIGYTGSKMLASALAMDKYRTKLIWQALDLPTAPMIALFKGDSIDVDTIVETLSLPLFVKPAGEGSSVGVTKVKEKSTIIEAIHTAWQYDNCALLESFLDGGEFSTPILGNEVLPTIQVIPDGEFYDYHAKYISNNTQYICPAFNDEAKQQEVAKLVLKAHHALGCKDYSRVDFMTNKDGKVFLMEVNTNPGMTTHSYFPKAAAHIGMDFATLVEKILLLSLAKV